MKLHAENMPLLRSLGFLWAGFYKYVAPLALGKAAVNAPRDLQTPGTREASGVRVALAPLWDGTHSSAE